MYFDEQTNPPGKLVFVWRSDTIKSFLEGSKGSRLIRSSHRDNSQKYLFFSSRSTFFGVFQEALCVHRTDTIFPERYVFSSNRSQFPGDVFSARRTDTIFSRKVCLFIEQIPIFQEHFFVDRTDTNFPGALFFGYRTGTDFPRSLFQISTNR